MKTKLTCKTCGKRFAPQGMPAHTKWCKTQPKPEKNPLSPELQKIKSEVEKLTEAELREELEKIRKPSILRFIVICSGGEHHALYEVKEGFHHLERHEFALLEV